jgi:hypothetical protein
MRTTGILLILLFVVALAHGADNFKAELKRLRVSTALVIHFPALDQFPVWSPDSRYIGVDVNGKWYRVELSNAHLVETTWDGNRVGKVAGGGDLEAMSQGMAVEWDKTTKHGSTYVTSNSGMRAEFKNNMSDLSTSLVLSRGTQRRIVFKSQIESCGGLTFSPDEKYVAYTCQTDGVFVTNIARALSTE